MSNQISALKSKYGNEKIKEYWFSIQLKPVGSACNMRCKYCYVRPWGYKNSVMTNEILEEVVKKLLRQNYSNPTISWHGGEPTLAGYNFFQHAMELIEKYRQPGQKVRNLIQTNATLITSQLARLFRKYNFGVSVSLDGPEDIHGINRVFPNGENSFSRVMEGIKILWKNGIEPSVICTVSRETLPFPLETFNFLVSQGFKKIKYSPVFDSTKDKFSITSDEWFEYLKTVFYRWFEIGDPTIRIRDLDEIIVWLVKKPLNLCTINRTCLHWVSVDPNGNLYPCEYLRKRYYYGNIKEIEQLSDIIHSAGYQEFERVYKKVPLKCQECKFFPMCGNGCPATREKNGKMSLDGIYAFCEERKRLYLEIKKVFENTLY